MEKFDKAKQEEIWRRANPRLEPFSTPQPVFDLPVAPASKLPPEEALAAEIRKCWRLYCGWSELLRRCPEGLRGRIWPHTSALKRQTEALFGRYQALCGKPLRPRGSPPAFADFWTGLRLVLADEKAAADESGESAERIRVLESLTGRKL